ncbi:hypothetical protein PT274_01455 [Leuconostocaceae bacterium ESL0958]|nr:hypothetical protein [Leuconostocaceae bacterium ESL0958]
MSLEKQAVLDELKKLLTDKGDDPMLAVLVDNLLFEIESYTHVPLMELPDDMTSSIAFAVFAWTNDTDFFGGEAKSAPVSSVTEGDVSVNFAVSAKKSQLISEYGLLSEKLKKQLNGYRRLVWD